ncbi:MAG: hypothetical protein ABFD82_23705 [Syntrophaceae bacterium]
MMFALPLSSQGEMQYKEYRGFLCVGIGGVESTYFVFHLFDKAENGYWPEYVGSEKAPDLQSHAVKISSGIAAIWVRVLAKEQTGGSYGHTGLWRKRLLIKRIINYSAEPVKAELRLKR